MSELVAMRQRIKAIETIKKVTHAMRLISMSLHARLRSKKKHLDDYKLALLNLISSITHVYPHWKHPILTPLDELEKQLLIIVGSQKGLCGTFNTHLFNFIHQQIPKEHSAISTILVGKKVVDNPTLQSGSLVMEFSEFTVGTLLSTAQKIADHIWHAHVPYSSVTIYYNYPKTFFLQKPRKVNLIPFEVNIIQQDATTKPPHEGYRWEQDPETILDFVAHKLIQSIIQDILFDSLIAEQAARFVAMDNSTRNAANLLDSMRLTYNKTRQAKITRELTDLVASFQENMSS